jgi:hypothetical protein
MLTPRNSADGQPVAHRRHLARLGLATVEGAAEDVRLRTTHRLHGSPELGGRGLVGDVAKLTGQLAVLDPEEPLPGELKLNRCMSIDQDRSPTT